MKALRWHSQKDIRLDEVPEPSPGEEEVKIRVKWCGICGSDVNEYLSGPLSLPTKRPHPMTGKQTPITLGHEFSGDVVEVGSGVTGTSVGDRVAVRPTMPCYQCYWCKMGRPILCSTLATLGLAADGAFAEYVVVSSDNIYKLSGQASYEAGAFCEPLSVAIYACNKADLIPGDIVAVIGAGTIGLLVLQAARALGASQVFVIEPIAKRRELALKLGATAAIDPREVDAGKEIANLTDGLRAALTFECAGPPPAMLTALNVSGRGGKIIEVGLMAEPCEFPFGRLFWHNKSIITSQGYEHEFPTALALLTDGRVNYEPMITAKIKLDDIIEQGFNALAGEGKEKHFKILVSPS